MYTLNPIRHIAHFLLLAILVGIGANTVQAAQGISQYGKPKYADGFAHFDYVNPNAPRGGTLTLPNPGQRTSFDKFNPFTLRGITAPGIDLMFESLAEGSADEVSSIYGLLAEDADFAIVAGGYNSSNTAHLVDLCADKLPTYFIKSAEKIISEKQIFHFDNVKKEEVLINEFIPQKEKVRVLLTCGASCPDAVVEDILRKTVSLFPSAKSVDQVVDQWVLEKNQ